MVKGGMASVMYSVVSTYNNGFVVISQMDTYRSAILREIILITNAKIFKTARIKPL